MKEIFEIPLLPPREKFAHKGNFGRVLIVAGSAGMMGAACLTTEACLRSGAGLVTLAVPASLLSVASVKLTCAMSHAFAETPAGSFSSNAVDSIVAFSENMDVVAIGPGLSQYPDTKAMVHRVLCDLNKPMVIDADALNALATQPDVLKKRKAPTIITPHPGEFSRLTGLSIATLKDEGLQRASQFALEYSCVVVLKFAPTLVSNGEIYYVNTTGNPGMATGGSGDVLTGVITGLLAQKLSPFSASQLGVYIHGMAGDIACDKKGEVGMIASDILDCLPDAFLKYQKGYTPCLPK